MGFFLVPTVKNTLNFVNAKTIRPYWDMVSPCLRNNSQLSITEIAKLMSLTVPWDPPKTVKPKRPGIDKEEPMYAYKLKTRSRMAACINLPLQNSRRILS